MSCAALHALITPDIFAGMRAPRRIWTEDRSTGGFGAHSVNGTWRKSGVRHRDVEENHYIETFRVAIMFYIQPYKRCEIRRDL